MDELERMRLRDEVLQAMYWMRSEGIADAPSVAELARFLAVEPAVLAPHLELFCDDGWLDSDAAGFRLTAEGERLGKRAFADEFADMTKPGHGECDEDCWCHDSPEEAARCLEDRRGHVHST